jgi:hypothetical protein
MSVECECRDRRNHEPWCAAFVKGVNTEETVPQEARHLAVFENGLREVLQRGEERFGGDAVRNVLIQDFLRREAQMRASYPPDHPALQLLDAYHADRRLRGET